MKEAMNGSKPEGDWPVLGFEESREKLSQCVATLTERSPQGNATVDSILAAPDIIRVAVATMHAAKDQSVPKEQKEEREIWVENQVKAAHECLAAACKGSKRIDLKRVFEAIPQLVPMLTYYQCVHFPAVRDFSLEVFRRAADVLTRLALKDSKAKAALCDSKTALMDLRNLLEQPVPRETKVHRAAANALIALDEHERIIASIKRATADVVVLSDTPVVADEKGGKKPSGSLTPEAFFEKTDELNKEIKRDTRALAELAKQDSANADTLLTAGALDALVPILHLGAVWDSGVNASRRSDQKSASRLSFAMWASAEKEACQALGVIASHTQSRAKRQSKVAESGGIKNLIDIIGRPPPSSSGSGLTAEARRAREAEVSSAQDLARRAADAVTKLAWNNADVKALIRNINGVERLKQLLERRDQKVQRAAAGALITLDEHENLVREVKKKTDEIADRPDDMRLRDVLKTSVRWLAELAKECQTFNQAAAEGDMVDAVVRAGAVEAIVPLLSLGQAIGEECTASIGDIEKEASYAISLLASKETNQNRIAEAGALPGLVALLKRYPPQLAGSVPPSVARRAADAVTNLAHENNNIKNQVRTEGGIPPLVSLLETRDAKVQRAAASALRTLAFKNDENKNQIVECGALPNLIFMVKSDDQAIHYEAVGVIGNLVHSSLHIKRRVLDEGALQPVIGLLSSHCPESQREAALLLGQFATTEPEFKVRIVQRGAVTPLIQMLSNTDSQLREMAAFALGRLAQNPDNQVGICHAKGLRPLLDLLDTDVGNLQHNAAFALYGLADNEDNVPDIIREGTVQRLKDRELMVQASKDCVQKTLKRLEDKMSGRVLRYLIYLMTTSDRSVARRITVALAYLCKPPLCRAEDHRQIFMEKGGMDILLSMLVPKQLGAANPAGGVILPEAAACQKDAATALHILWQRVGSFAPAEEASVPPTPVARDDELLKDPALCDVTFVVEGRQEIHAHKIAFANAPVAFHDEMDARKTKTSTSREGSERDVVELPDVSRAAFEAMVRFTYAGELGEGLTVETLLDVLKMSHGYGMVDLKRQCEIALTADLHAKGADADPWDTTLLFETSELVDARTLSKACAGYALEHRAKMVDQLHVAGYTKLITRMVPYIREHLHAMFYRLQATLTVGQE